MGKLIDLSIDVTKITKSKLYQGQKGKYLNLTVAVNDDKDDYGNDVSCWEKCGKDETKNYLGNGKVFWTNDNDNNPVQKSKSVEDEDDDLPF